MRELTFKGFLKKYVRSLSLSGTGGLYKLAVEAGSGNPRLTEPLFLYALFSGTENVLLAAAKIPALRRVYEDMLARYDRHTIELALQANDPALPDGYAKVYRSYLYEKNKTRNDAHTKKLMRGRITRLQQEKNISTYRLYTDLRFNPGNMNSFIKHGDTSKVSLEATRQMLSYLEQR